LEGFHEPAEQMLKTAARLGKRVMLLFADIDDFKAVRAEAGPKGVPGPLNPFVWVNTERRHYPDLKIGVSRRECMKRGRARAA
jgi:hypothetical protein